MYTINNKFCNIILIILFTKFEKDRLDLGWCEYCCGSVKAFQLNGRFKYITSVSIDVK